MSSILYLASGSSTRHALLEQAGITFTVLSNQVNEELCSLEASLLESVKKLARYKMGHCELPLVQTDSEICILTADTLTQDMDGAIYGKPKDKADAVRMIKKLRQGSHIATGACLRLYIPKNNQWVLQEEVIIGVESSCVFAVPDERIDEYLCAIPWQLCAGAIQIEGYGFRYLKSIEGSYTAILGLPLYEITAELHRLGFFKTN